MYIAAIGVAYLGSYIAVVEQVGYVSSGGYLLIFWEFQNPPDLLFSVIKGMTMATAIVLVGCYYGYNASGGPVGVGKATAKSMVLNLVLVTLIGMLGTQVFWGANPRARSAASRTPACAVTVAGGATATLTAMSKTLAGRREALRGAGSGARAAGSVQEKRGLLEGPEHVITWAVGHLVQLAEPEEYDPKFKSWRMADLPIVPDGSSSWCATSARASRCRSSRNSSAARTSTRSSTRATPGARAS